MQMWYVLQDGVVQRLFEEQEEEKMEDGDEQHAVTQAGQESEPEEEASTEFIFFLPLFLPFSLFTSFSLSLYSLVFLFYSSCRLYPS